MQEQEADTTFAVGAILRPLLSTILAIRESGLPDLADGISIMDGCMKILSVLS